eukprot:COSAG02_NODE_12330_length_1561_cov_1.976060_1_plen_298_part_00
MPECLLTTAACLVPPRWSSYCVLGRVIEAVTGRSYHEFVRTELWDKLNIPKEEIGFGRSLLGQEKTNEVAYCAHVVLMRHIRTSLQPFMSEQHLASLASLTFESLLWMSCRCARRSQRHVCFPSIRSCAASVWRIQFGGNGQSRGHDSIRESYCAVCSIVATVVQRSCESDRTWLVHHKPFRFPTMHSICQILLCQAVFGCLLNCCIMRQRSLTILHGPRLSRSRTVTHAKPLIFPVSGTAWDGWCGQLVGSRQMSGMTVHSTGRIHLWSILARRPKQKHGNGWSYSTVGVRVRRIL